MVSTGGVHKNPSPGGGLPRLQHALVGAALLAARLAAWRACIRLSKQCHNTANPIGASCHKRRTLTLLEHHLVHQFRTWLSGLQVLKFGHCTDAGLWSNEACSDVAVHVAPSAMLVLHASTRLRDSGGRMRKGLTQEKTLCGRYARDAVWCR
jgi:hypothetical protein